MSTCVSSATLCYISGANIQICTHTHTAIVSCDSIWNKCDATIRCHEDDDDNDDTQSKSITARIAYAKHVCVCVCGALGKKAYDDIEILSNIHILSVQVHPFCKFDMCSFDSRCVRWRCWEPSAALRREIHVTHM